ncbi:MAG TPA: hypothetical protein VKM54_12900, partial [Myxococcota bacterium]|nr:hypothetical protein [Myxococcota bacterium]
AEAGRAGPGRAGPGRAGPALLHSPLVQDEASGENLSAMRAGPLLECLSLSLEDTLIGAALARARRTHRRAGWRPATMEDLQ